MAEKVDETVVPSRRGNGHYDWESWFDGGWWKLQRGVDFHCADNSLRTAALSAARRRGLKVEMRFDGNTAYLRAFEPSDE